MKNKRFRRILTLVLLMSLLFTVCALNYKFITASEPIPAILDSPNIILYDSGCNSLNLTVKALAPKSFLDFYEKAFSNSYNDSNDKSYSDYGEWYGTGHNSGIQIDWKIDDGEWQYNTGWDKSLYRCQSNCYEIGQNVSEISLGTVSSDYNYGIADTLNSLGFLKETTDGSDIYYRFDSDNHTITVRARYFITLSSNNHESKIIMSDWSNIASYGEPAQSVPSVLGAPVISDLVIYGSKDYKGSPRSRFNIFPDGSATDTMFLSRQYDSDLKDSSMSIVIETSLDPDFNAGSTIVKKTVSETSSLYRRQTYDSLFYDLWYELPKSNHEAFEWNGETIYLRAKYVNERNINGKDSSIESPYSNVLSIKGPNIPKYNINVTHNSYGFDDSKYYTESFSITKGLNINLISCAPLEGCYVDTVLVNNVTMYDKNDKNTYKLLKWNSDFTNFYFIKNNKKASKDLNIIITYAGTPTVRYGITTECSNGGKLTSDSVYDSWNDNSLVVYHGTEPKIDITPDEGFEIDTVLIDGIANADAKSKGYYIFPAVKDSTHSISATFKRVAYNISSYAYHGTINSNYEGYESTYDYVRIGDNIKFTFEPAKDSDGNYYEIDKVYIDYIINEDAKNTGSYTFTNVQANHDISVYYSEDPVITHDVTAGCGENGSISPKGIIHVREGNIQHFSFIPDSGYEVDKVFIDGKEITNLATKEYFNVSNITKEHDIYVTFKKLPIQYDINVIVSGDNPSVHAVNPKGVTPVLEGESFTVNYNPFAGYEVEKVLVNNSPYKATGTYSIENVNADNTIEIFFKIKNYTVTFVDYDGTILKTDSVEHGSQATPPMEPEREHYIFAGWDTTYSDITTNVKIRATYTPAEYNVKFLSWDGKIIKTDSVSYKENAIAPEPPLREGYEFIRWSHDYTNIDNNLEVTAVYKQKKYSVTFLDSDNTILSKQTVKHGETAKAPANPYKEGYTFTGWDNNNYGLVTQNMTIKAMYAECNDTFYTVIANSYGNNGKVSPAGLTKVQANGSLTLYFTPDSFSKIVKIVIDGTEIDICNSYTLDNITENHTVYVYFAPTAVINVKNDLIKNGTASGHYDLLDGTMVYMLDVKPDDGYELENIYINNEPATLETFDGEYIIRNLSDNLNIDVHFRHTLYNRDDSTNNTIDTSGINGLSNSFNVSGINNIHNNFGNSDVNNGVNIIGKNTTDLENTNPTIPASNKTSVTNNDSLTVSGNNQPKTNDPNAIAIFVLIMLMSSLLILRTSTKKNSKSKTDKFKQG